MKIIETDRLVLKIGTVDDWVKVHEYDFNYLMGIDGVFEYVKRTPEEVRGWFDNFSPEEYYKKQEKENIHHFIIYIKEMMTPIGYISFDRNDNQLKSTEVACYIHPNHWGNGYMQEALIGSMEYIYEKGFENIIYSYHEKNDKSKKICEKVGFEAFKQLRENNCFGNENIVYSNIMSRERFNELYKSGKNTVRR